MTAQSSTWEAVVLARDGEVLVREGPGERRPTASVGKLWLLAELAERLGSGGMDPGRVIARSASEPVRDSGLWQHMDADNLAVIDAALLIAAVSDNAATNALLDVISLDAAADRARQLGARESRLHDRVRDVRDAVHPPSLSTGVAVELAEAARRIHLASKGQPGLGVSPAAARVMEAWLSTGVDTTLVLDPLALDPLAHVDPSGGVWAWCKTGADPGVRADVGVVEGPLATVAYAAIATWPLDRGRSGLLEARLRMRQLGSSIAERVGLPTP